MPSYLKLEEVKRHLNVEHDEDDGYITELMEVAEDQLAETLARPLYDVECSCGGLPATLRHALRLLVARHYSDREGYRSGRMTELPFALSCLIAPYRKES